MICEGCENTFTSDMLDENSLCEECHIEQGIDRVESMRDAYD